MKTEPDPQDLSERAADSRARLDAIVSQLDQRRHVLVRATTTMKQKPLWTAGGTLAVAGMAAALVIPLVRRHRNRQRLASRGRRIARALSVFANNPERVSSKDPTMAGKLMTAVAATILTTLAKRLMERAIKARAPAVDHG